MRLKPLDTSPLNVTVVVRAIVIVFAIIGGAVYEWHPFTAGILLTLAVVLAFIAEAP